MIDYERIQRLKARGGVTTLLDKERESYPQWVITEPTVKDPVERLYDINRDSKLQTAEVKTFLRDVLEEIESKNGYLVDSDILKEYDKNKDGIISKYESDDIRKQVNP